MHFSRVDMLDRIYLTIALDLNIINDVLNNLHACPFITTKTIEKITL